MQVIMDAGQRVPIKAWIDGVELEDAARAQLVNTAKLPFIYKHVAVMPDVHWGNVGRRSSRPLRQRRWAGWLAK